MVGHPYCKKLGWFHDDLRACLRLQLSVLLDDPRFIDALPGHLPPDAASQSRVTILLQRIREFANG